MTIELRTKPGEKIIELGGGACPRFRPNVDVRPCYDAQGNQTVDFTADFNQSLPIQSEEWDGVFCQFALEHISYTKVPGFLAEVFRILKPGGKAVFVIPNTEAQVHWILNHSQGWDGKDFFNSASEKLFGTQDYPENSHKCYFNALTAHELFHTAGFNQVQVSPYGERQTDMVVQAVRPARGLGSGNAAAVDEKKGIVRVVPRSDPVPEGLIIASGQFIAGKTDALITYEPEKIYTHKYFDCNGPLGPFGHWDHPWNEIAFRNIMAWKPESVLELGCGRGYLLKRFQDAGIYGVGLEVSKHAYMTRVTNNVVLHNVIEPFENKKVSEKIDLCFSVAFLEHVPEQHLPAVLGEMARTCKRGLHAINFAADPNDPYRCTIRSKQWWVDLFRKHCHCEHMITWEILSVEELHQGEFPQEVMNGDGKLKLNVGSYTTMFHHGWENLDQHDLHGFASSFGFKFKQHDVRNGLPYSTGVVDLIYSSHFLEHLTYEEGLRFLRECRRVIRPGGAMRLIVPDASLLNRIYVDGEDGGRSPFDSLSEFDEVNGGCASSPTAAGKLHALLWGGDHKAVYDAETLCKALDEAGFEHRVSAFRQGSQQVLRETLDSLPCLSLYVEAIPSHVG